MRSPWCTREVLLAAYEKVAQRRMHNAEQLAQQQKLEPQQAEADMQQVLQMQARPMPLLD